MFVCFLVHCSIILVHFEIIPEDFGVTVSLWGPVWGTLGGISGSTSKFEHMFEQIRENEADHFGTILAHVAPLSNGSGQCFFSFLPSEELRRFKRRGLQNRQYRPYDLHDFVMAGAPLHAARARGKASCRTIWAMALTIHGSHCSTASALEWSMWPKYNK